MTGLYDRPPYVNHLSKKALYPTEQKKTKKLSVSPENRMKSYDNRLFDDIEACSAPPVSMLNPAFSRTAYRMLSVYLALIKSWREPLPNVG